MRHYSGQNQQEQLKTSKSRREFMVLIAALLLMSGGFLFLKPANLPQPDKMSGSAFNQLLQQSGNASSVSRQIPSRFKDKGTVDERYTVATDPKTGEMLINDSLGGMGSNNTSVDGDRAKLANDMLDLDRYAENNRKKLSSDAYYWLKKVAVTGMKLAFGTPGLAPAMQPPIKRAILTEFHNISANPDKSFLMNSEFLALEAIFKRPEAAYLADGDISGTNYLSIDPLSPPLRLAFPLNQSLYNTLSVTNLEPTMTDLTLSSSPYAYTTSVLTANTISPGSVDLSSSTIRASVDATSTLSTTHPITTSTTTALGTTTTTSGPTVADYYHDVLGVPLSNTSAP